MLPGHGGPLVFILCQHGHGLFVGEEAPPSHLTALPAVDTPTPLRELVLQLEDAGEVSVENQITKY
jgi:hypothetical protein